MSRAGPVVTSSRAAYLREMPPRLLPLLVLLAMILMPVRMAAEAHLPIAAPGSHAMAGMTSGCGDHEAPADEGKADLKVECMMACAAIPGTHQVAERVSLSEPIARPGAATHANGRSHNADPPPPRCS
ncbi:hypothetical protein [Sphingosinicella terrae]|uniref:hypothetical protein n=1 Tax=Sphingosinicella terrae TaxID=2172047 RepID=UPI000E0CFD14|nr:hypothetical protein [Sphingosinicella terrae]